MRYDHHGAQEGARAHAVKSITFADGSRQFFEYDDRGRLTRSFADGGQAEVRRAYDEAGGVTISAADGAQARLFLNEGGRVGRYELPEARLYRLTHDERGRLTSLTGPLGFTVRTDYDERGLPTRVTGPEGSAADLAFTADTRQLERFRDARGVVVGYERNVRGDLTRLVYDDGTFESYGYDARGNLTAFTDRAGGVTRRVFDPRNLLTRLERPDGSSLDITYDARRNPTVLVETDAAGTRTTSLTYDTEDRLIRIDAPGNRSLAYTYDAFGRRTRLTTHDGFVVHYAYDPQGRLERLTDADGALLTAYRYNPAGRVTRTEHGNGTATTYAYNGLGQTTSIAHFGADGLVLERFDSAYDAAGRLIAQTTLAGTTRYGYDAASQLTSVVLPNGRRIGYEYDAAGNRIAVTDDGVLTATVTNRLNQVVQAGEARYEYDRDGRLVRKTEPDGETVYRYNAEGRLNEVRSPAGTWFYEYDVFGNRSAVVRDGTRTEMLVDPFGIGNIIAEYAGDLRTAGYAHGLGLAARVAESGTAHYSFDTNSNTALLTGPDGVVLNRYDYLPFGEVASATEAVANPFAFGGRFGVATDGNGLAFMRARFYDPQLGRFTQQDPLRLAAGDGNFYRYAFNQPTQFLDPTGLDPRDRVGQGTNALEAAQFQQSEFQRVMMANGNDFAGSFYPESSTYNGGRSIHPAQADLFELYGETRPAGLAPPSDVDVSAERAAGYRQSRFGAHDPFPLPGPVTPRPQPGFFSLRPTVPGVSAALGRANPIFVAEELLLSPPVGFAWGLNFDFSSPFCPLARERIETDERFEDHTGDRFRGLLLTFHCWNLQTAEGIMQSQPFGGGQLPASLLRRLLTYKASIVGSNDPNSIEGPAGVLDERFLTDEASLDYSIHFENLASATAPAATVTITQQLDTSLDLTTFTLGRFGFGDVSVDVPQGLSRYTTRLDFAGERGFLLDVEASLDMRSGVATWIFTALDPATGDIVTDPDGGFLPPNDATGRGQGFVEYAIRVRDSLPTGTPIRAQAAIIFDVNDPIVTNEWHNTLDAEGPTGGVAALPPETTTMTIPLRWSGDDGAGSGAETFDVFVAVDGGEFTPLLIETTATSADYAAEAGHTYAFYAVARDVVGQRRPTPIAAQAQTHVLTPTAGLDTGFLRALYADLLGRAPDDGGVDYWAGRLQAGAMRTDVAQGFWESLEHRGRQVDRLYADLLGRAADAAGRAHWIEGLRGGLSEAAVRLAFLNSTEYQMRNAGATVLVQSLYREILGREAALDEVAHWTGRADAARAIASSREATLRLVDQYYQTYLGRSGEEAGRNAWLAVLTRGANAAEVAWAFLGSEEYRRRPR